MASSAASSNMPNVLKSADKLRVELLTKYKNIDHLDAENVITEKMLNEERLLEEKLVAEEEVIKQQVAEEEKKIEEEKVYKRLHLLLSRSSIYAKYMADKLVKHEDKVEKKRKRDEGRKDKQNGTGTSPAKKKHKAEVDMMEVLKKENLLDREDNKDLSDEEPCKPPPSSDDVDVTLQPGLLTGGVMRRYQYDGYEWMKTLYENGVNGILADEMGLGKTIQCIAFIAHLIDMGVPGPFFVCGPLSTVPNWYAEFKRFTPEIPVILYHGDILERQEMRKKINKKVNVGDKRCCPVVITSYSIALNDVTHLKSTKWKLLVIDEAHRIKNFQCKLIGALKTFDADHRLLLTGTPLQNDLSELWSLLNFILPEIFDDLKVFQSWFDISRLTQNGITKEIIAREQEKKIVSTIHQILTPFLLRRTKQDVKLKIPHKKEVVVECPFSSLQQKYYSAVLKKTIEKVMHHEGKNVEDFAYNENRTKRIRKQTQHFGDDTEILSQIIQRPAKATLSSEEDDFIFSEIHLNTRNCTMCLRRICCHPYLISYPLDPATADYLVDEDIVKSSGKMMVLDLLLAELKKRGHKVLIFSQFVGMIEVLQDYCYFRKYGYTRLIGNMSLSERQEEMKKFHEDPDTFIFLISTKAGGLGINLIAADTVIIFDSDWNPQGDLQAQDRCHRIGQTKPVVVYRLIIRNTADERVYDFANAKRKLEKVIIQKGRFASKSTAPPKAITTDELYELLEACEVNGFVKTDSKDILPQEELERLLDRSDLMMKEEALIE